MVNYIKGSLVLLVLVATACDDYRLRVEVQASGCAFREVTAGRVSEVFAAGTTSNFERHSDAFKGTAMTFEVVCGADIKRFTIAGTSCEEDCKIRPNICDIDLLRGEVARVAISKDGLFFGLQICKNTNDIDTASIGPDAIPPDLPMQATSQKTEWFSKIPTIRRWCDLDDAILLAI